MFTCQLAIILICLIYLCVYPNVCMCVFALLCTYLTLTGIYIYLNYSEYTQLFLMRLIVSRTRGKIHLILLTFRFDVNIIMLTFLSFCRSGI